MIEVITSVEGSVPSEIAMAWQGLVFCNIPFDKDLEVIHAGTGKPTSETDGFFVKGDEALQFLLLIEQSHHAHYWWLSHFYGIKNKVLFFPRSSCTVLPVSFVASKPVLLNARK